MTLYPNSLEIWQDIEPNDIAAVIVSFNPDPDRFKTLIEAISPQIGQIIVVDNASTIEVSKLLGPGKTPTVLLGQKNNQGIAWAQNRGIAWAESQGYKAVLLLDHDSVPEADMVEKLLHGAKKLSETKKIGAVGAFGRQARDTSGAKPGEELVYISQKWGPRRVQQYDCQAVKTAFLIASGSLIPLKVLENVGPMNSKYFIDHVDLEWSLRAQKLSWQLYALPQAHMEHQLGDQTVQLAFRSQPIHLHSPFRNYYLTRNTIFLIRSGLLSTNWKIGYLIWLGKYLAFNTLLAGNGWQRFSRMLAGLRDAIFGTL